MVVRFALAVAATLFFVGFPSASNRPAAVGDLYTRVVDVGGGLCTITRIPGEDRYHYVVYDAGHWTGGKCFEAAQEIVTDTEDIDLMILSHSDSDHLGDVPEILEGFNVLQILWAGLNNSSAATWRNANEAIGEEAKLGASIHNLQSVPLEPGRTLTFGDAKVVLVAGWKEWTGSGPTASERVNAVSIVVRVEYKGKSILFGGDTVGRRKSDPDSACKDAEKIMVDRHTANEVLLKSDVMIAPHHGGNNGSSACFISAVSPTHVIFSAGHAHEHPTAGAANRYLAHGVQQNRIFRTDRGDDESGSFEWKVGSINGCSDPRGDDDVEIVISQAGTLTVKYRQPANGC